MIDDFNLAEFLPYRLAVLSERVSGRLEVEYRRSHGLTVAEWRVLVNLRQLGKASVRDIQVLTNLEKSRVSRAVVRLEQAGQVKKQTSKRDARLLEIALTSKGHATLDAIIPLATEVETRLTAALDPKDIEGFYTVMAHVHAVLDDDPEARKRLDPQMQSSAQE